MATDRLITGLYVTALAAADDDHGAALALYRLALLTAANALTATGEAGTRVAVLLLRQLADETGDDE